MKKGQKSIRESPMQTAKAHLIRALGGGGLADGNFSLNRTPGHVQGLFSVISPKWTDTQVCVDSLRVGSGRSAGVVRTEVEPIHTCTWLPRPGGQARCSEGKSYRNVAHLEKQALRAGSVRFHMPQNMNRL